MSNSNSHRFQVDLGGMIDLLSSHLYSSPRVYIRELLQNAVDALRMREALGDSFEAVIRVELIPAGDKSSPSTLIFEDTGIGLTESEVHEFLATIARSSKPDALGEARDDYIGQFGIGLLSCFTVSRDIVLHTRSSRGTGSVEWRGRPDGTYEVRRLEAKGPVGTRVFLQSRAEMREYFDREFVAEHIRTFGRLLPYPITFCSQGMETEIERDVPPFRRQWDDPKKEQQALLEFGRDEFGVGFFDAFPLRAKDTGLEGAIFIVEHTTTPQSRQSHRVYLKDMFLSDSAENLLPEWAFFVRCVINSRHLRPTASREEFYEDDDLERAREALGQSIKDYLFDLAYFDRERLDRLLTRHALPIKALSLEDEEFYKLVVDWLPFETPFGRASLGDLRREHSPLRYASELDQYRQIEAVARAQSMMVVNAGYVYDAEILERLPQVLPDIVVELIDATDVAQEFEELSIAQQEVLAPFVDFAASVIERFDCAVAIRSFRPRELACLYNLNRDASFLRSVERSQELSGDVFSVVLDGVAAEARSTARTELCLNHSNDLIRRLCDLGEGDLSRRIVELLYVHSLLLGHHALKREETELLSCGFLSLIDFALGEEGRR